MFVCVCEHKDVVRPHLGLTKGGRKAEQIQRALAVNRLLMSKEEKHRAQMKPFSEQRRTE